MEKEERSAETEFMDATGDEPILPEGYAEGDDIFEGEAQSGDEAAQEEAPAQESAQKEPPADKAAQAPAQEGAAEQERDFRAEALEFYRENPDCQGRQLPQKVLEAWISGKPLKDAWREGQAGETEQLKKELQTLRQTVKNQQRAPVRGVSGFGAAESEPDDPFLEGLRTDW
jgi:hypothetical protein